MYIVEGHDITKHTGFKTPVSIKRHILIDDTVTKQAIRSAALYSPLIIGGGTNYLFVNPTIDIAVSYIGQSIRVIKDDEYHTIMRVEAGMNWHTFVMEMLSNSLYGLENLVLIPGTVGASPVQNIGAYGREVSESIHTVHCLDLETGEQITYSNEQCAFEYRHSIFKSLVGKHLLITHVDFLLHKKEEPRIHYPDILKYCAENDIKNIGSLELAHVIMAIRSAKLPDPDKVGNAGSFFKNPIISKLQYQALQCEFDTLPCYNIDDEHVKVPAGWLIDQAGWKGFRHNGAGVHEQQALVLVNADDANGQDILDLSKKIQLSIFETFGITLEPEVNIIE